MNSTTFLGFVLLALVLAGVFIGLYFAYGAVGKAVELAEEQNVIVPCATDDDCENGVCKDNYCRKLS